MADKKVRWGLLSTARINRAVIEPIQALPRNELVAVGSRSLDKAQAYAREWKIPRAHGSYEDLLADPEVDVLYIGLPNDMHAEWAVKCAEAGKHTLVEKPLALTVADAERMFAAAKQHGTVMAEAFMYRHHPQTHVVRQMVADGQFGPIRTTHGSFSFYLSRGVDIRLMPERGGGSLWDVGCYPVSYTRTVLAEEPVEVRGWQTVTEEGVDTTFVGFMRFASGTLATFDCGFRSPDRWGFEIAGERGSLLVPSPFKPYMKEHLVYKHDGQAETIPSPPLDLYVGEIEDMADAILEGKPPRITAEDSIANTRVLVALYQSAQEGKPVTL